MVSFTSSPFSPQSEVSGMKYYMAHNSTFRSCLIEDGLAARPSSIELGLDRIQKIPNE